jgi:hypothetical protein
MLIPIHAEITQKALSGIFTPKILDKVIQANQKQDGLQGQIGHPEFHFDDNKMIAGFAYIQHQRSILLSSLQNENMNSAWQAFGRLLHTVQDFYAHSNYVSLWLSRFTVGSWPSPEEIDPMEQELMVSAQLTSGKLYYPLEVFSFVPFLKNLVLPRLPGDSHAWMNLDSPAVGAKFEYAFSAALKRTSIEFESIKAILENETLDRFIHA